MSMSELTDDQLDGLFRKSAEEFDPPFDPVAWRDMKTRLDANDRTVGTPIWKNLLRWGLPMVLLLLLSGGGWYIYRRAYPVVGKPNTRVIPNAGPALSRKANQPQPATATPTSDNEPVRTTTVGSKESDAAKQPTDLAASVAEPARPESRSDKPTARPEGKTISKSAIATKRPALAYRLTTERNRLTRSRLARSRVSIDKSAIATARYRMGRTTSQTSGITRKQRRTVSNYPTTAFIAKNDATVPTSGAQSTKQRGQNSQESTRINRVDVSGSATSTIPLAINEIASVPLLTLSELTIRPAKWPTLAFSDRAVAIKPDTAGRRVVPKLASERGLSIRVVAAPDLSAVGLKNFSRPGTNVGLLLEYRLAPRWSVQAGVLQSTKVYKASGDDYGYLPDYIQRYRTNLAGLDGRCNMLDIPINLRYDVALRPQSNSRLLSRWFVSGGVTSYIMKQEDYNYKYIHFYPGNRTEISESTGGYSFSNLNLSVGYERALNQRLSFQIEPFMKMPLRGVGYFKVKLLSTGAFFSIRYKLSK